MAWPRDSNGWTVFTPKTDGTSATNTWVYYVDPVSGDDDTGAGYQATEALVGSDPRQPASTPVTTYETIQEALNDASTRNNSNASNWILVKAGTTSTISGSSRVWKLTGVDQQLPALFSSYGEGARPILRYGMSLQGGGGITEEYHDIAFVGLHFYDTLKDPDHADWDGYPTHTNLSVQMITSGIWSESGDPVQRNWLIEDCRLQFMQLNVQWQSGSFSTGHEVRRCGLGPNYSTSNGAGGNNGHTQNVFASATEGMLFEDVVAYYGG